MVEYGQEYRWEISEVPEINVECDSGKSEFKERIRWY